MFRWLKLPQKLTSRPNRKLVPRRAAWLRLEALEHRLAPATFNVTTLADGGPGSLRADILMSNATAGPNAINLTLQGTYRLSLFGNAHDGTNGALQIDNQSVTINNTSGGPAIIDGGGVDRVFDIEGSIAGGVSFNGVTIANGLAGDNGNKGSDTFGNSADGGGIYSPQTNVILNNSVVTNNLADFDGGGIWTDTGNVTLNASTISGNDADNPGGGIFSQSGTITVINSTISGNVADGDGGGMSAENGSISVTGSTISGNNAFEGGGLSLSSTSPGTGSLTITSSTITDNVGVNAGGGVFQGSHGTTTLTNSTISGNSADSEAGGLYILSGTAMISGCTISGNSAQSDGGIEMKTGSSFPMTDTTVINNHASTTGGGLGISCMTLTITNSSINNNRSGSNQGGIFAVFTTGMFTNVNIIGNHSGGNDGGLDLADTMVTMSGCNISDNLANSGSAGIAAVGSATFTSCTISGNHAGSNVGGLDFVGADLILSDSTISGNTSGADSGGAYIALDTGGSISNCTISGNSAALNGGGLEIHNSAATPFAILDSAISRNHSGADGGGIVDDGTGFALLRLSNDTLFGNTASVNGGGIAIEGSVNDSIDFVTISGNAAANGGGAFQNAGTVNVQNTIIAGNAANATHGPDVNGTFVTQGNNLIGVADASSTSFVNGTMNDQVGSVASPINALLGPLQNNGGPTFSQALKPGSPAVGAAAGAGAPTTDQRGFPRPGAGQNAPSIGALETQMPSFLGISANGAYVENLYEALLDRTADPGAAGWVTALANGASAATVVAGIEGSTEYRTDEVQGLYVTYLHRAADPGGLQHFVNVLNSGGTVEQVAEVLVSSGEYFQLHGGANDAFLTAIYYDALGRGGSPAEQTGFLQGLNGGTMSRAQVAAAIFGSAEYRNDLVENDYQEFLGRNADPGGLAAWSAQLQSGMTDAQLAAGLLGSAEGFAKRS
jgi:hypothetical protein